MSEEKKMGEEWAWCLDRNGEGSWAAGATREEARLRCMEAGGGCIGRALRGDAVVDALVDPLSGASVLRDWEEAAAGELGEVAEDVFLGCGSRRVEEDFSAELRPLLLGFARKHLNLPEWVVEPGSVVEIDANGGES